MAAKPKTAVIVCPGRGSYQKSELGYLQKYHHDKAEVLESFDAYRKTQQQPTLSELDSADEYDRTVLERGDNASALIYACAYADFMSIDRQQYDIVGVTGNSMGWYIALACAAALSSMNALHLINHMGSLMHQQQRGGQLLYPLLDEDWKVDHQLIDTIERLKKDIQQQSGCELYDSIRLGGFEVLAGNDTALKAFSRALDVAAPYPIRLPGHGAYHSPMMQSISEQARTSLSSDLFTKAGVPLIDGRGKLWEPLSGNSDELWDYTLGTQIVQTYDYSLAIQNSLKELSPDCLILLGPGNSLGAVTAQAMIDINWQGLSCKQDFSERQSGDPIILSMGLSAQRKLIC